MSVPVFENPPRINPVIDENGFVKLTPDDIQRLLEWMEAFMRHVSDNT